jgi:hypothetical protein
MNVTKLLASLFAAGALISAGCSRSSAPPPVPTGKWDPIKLGLAFQDAPPEINEVENQAVLDVRRTEYEKAIAKLDSLLSNDKVTAAQKAALTNAIQQIKDKANAAAAVPAQ